MALEKIGIPVKKSQHEAGMSQHQFDLRTQDAFSIADSILSFKLAVKQIAMKHDVFASFMPRPLNNQPGSSLHLHIHLSDDKGQNIFYAENAQNNSYLSTTARQFTAGILKYARELCLITNQYQNSFKRLIANDCKTTQIGWSETNRSSIIRVPGGRPGKQDKARIELRFPDPACNPYLALAVIINAGLSGIKEKLELEDNIETSGDESKTPKELPYTLGEAISEFEKSKLVRETLGDTIFDYILKTKRAEWMKAISVVDEYELKNYLAVL